jgi:hypothetical protein
VWLVGLLMFGGISRTVGSPHAVPETDALDTELQMHDSGCHSVGIYGQVSRYQKRSSELMLVQNASVMLASVMNSKKDENRFLRGSRKPVAEAHLTEVSNTLGVFLRIAVKRRVARLSLGCHLIVSLYSVSTV